MSKVVIKAWIKELTSGKRKQGRGYLRSANDEYCCLGVLCDLHAKRSKLPWLNVKGKPSQLYLGRQSVLPPQVEEWALVGTTGGVVDVHKLSPGLKAYLKRKGFPRFNNDTISLVELNDGGIPFKTIAKLISSNAYSPRYPGA